MASGALNRFTQFFTGGAVIGKGGTKVKRVTRGTVAVDPASVSANSRGTTSVTITGVKTGDLVIMVPPSALEAGLVSSGSPVTADDTVSLMLNNVTASPVDGTSRTWEYLWIQMA